MKQPPSILIVEDEEAIRVGLTDVLVYHGFTVDIAEEGIAGLQKAQSGKYDLILLDVMLPGMNGFDICEKIRETDKSQAIIMLTAKSSDEDIIVGFQLGADDYVAKPFSITQLILRIKAVLKRTLPASHQEPLLTLSRDCTVDTINLTGRTAQGAQSFTKREIEVIAFLYENRHRPVSREELLSVIWGYSEDLQIETRTVDIHIARIRRKIEPDAKAPQILITVRGAGYKLLQQS